MALMAPPTLSTYIMIGVYQPWAAYYKLCVRLYVGTGRSGSKELKLTCDHSSLWMITFKSLLQAYPFMIMTVKGLST